MITVLTVLESFIFFVLAILHFSWAIGNTWGFDRSLPTNEKGKRIMNPTKVDSAIVGAGLLLFSIVYLFKSSLFGVGLPAVIDHFGGWLISVIFILRAVGEFKFVGFFKRIKGTPFATMDTKFYSPLCLAIGGIGIIIELKIP